MYVTEFPDVTVAAQRITYTQIPGRSGSLAVREGDRVYDDVSFSVDCYISDLSNVDDIAQWLQGSGDLILGNRPDRKRIACASEQLSLSKILRGRTAHTFSVTFRCEPFTYEVVPDVIPVNRNPASIIGEGTVDSDPLIVINGTGDVALTVGDAVLTLSGLTGAITIDCARRIAYNGTTSLSHLVGGTWPVMSTGTTAISWTGSISSLTITPNWRWL